MDMLLPMTRGNYFVKSQTKQMLGGSTAWPGDLSFADDGLRTYPLWFGGPELIAVAEDNGPLDNT
jgi:hypothetical protein